MCKTEMPRNPRANHIYGIQTAGGGFGGFPTGGNLKSGFSSEAASHEPSFEIPQAKIMPKLNTGRRWVHEGELPLHKEDTFFKLDAFSKQVFLYGFPQSTQHMSAYNGRASNPETAAYMNPKSVPFYEDLADAQGRANQERVMAAALPAGEEDLGRLPTEAELKKAGKVRVMGEKGEVVRMSDKLKPIPEDDLKFITPEEGGLRAFFRDAAKVRLEQTIGKLRGKGFTEEEIGAYLTEQRKADLVKAAKGDVDDVEAIEDVLIAMRAKQMKPTGSDAAGIVPLGATQNISVSKLVRNETYTRPEIPVPGPTAGWNKAARSYTEDQPSDAQNLLIRLVGGKRAGLVSSMPTKMLEDAAPSGTKYSLQKANLPSEYKEEQGVEEIFTALAKASGKEEKKLLKEKGFVGVRGPRKGSQAAKEGAEKRKISKAIKKTLELDA